MRRTLFLLNRRARYHWQMLLTLSLGVFLATALMASGPILIDNVLALTLRRTMLNAAALDSNLLLTDRQPPEQTTYNTLSQNIDTIVPQHFPAESATLIPTASLRPVYGWQSDRLISDERLLIRFYGRSRTDIDQRVTFVSGGWPENSQPAANQIAIVISQPLAQAYSLSAGDQLPISLQNSATTPDLTFIISGVIQPLDAQDPFWFGELSPLRAQDNGRFRVYSVLVPPDAFFPIAQDHFTDLSIDAAWHLQLDPTSLTMPEAEVLPLRTENLTAVLQELESNVNVTTELPTTIETFLTQADAVRGPLYFLVTTVVLLALYYVTMVASLGLIRLQQEFVLLRSRGASAQQLIRLQLTEGLIICATALVSGPLLARLMIQWLAVFGPLAQISESDWTLSVPQVAWLAAVVGAAACLASLLWPVPNAIRKTAHETIRSQTRTTHTTWWQNYYLDVVLLLVGLILLWRFVAVGGLGDQTTGSGQADWLIIFAPLALLFGSATLLLRIFPVLLNLAAQIIGRRPGLTAALAFWQTARDPRHVTRLVLLLTLTMAIGIFATSLSAALTFNEEARAEYAVGGDVRLINIGSVNDLDSVADDPAVSAVSPLWRVRGSFDSAINGGYPTFELLAVEPDSMGQIVEYRSDFAQKAFPTLFTEMETYYRGTIPEEGMALPNDAASIGIWLRLPVDDPAAWEGFDFDIKLIDANNQLHLIPLTPTGTEENRWRYYASDIANQLPQPLHVRSLWLRSRTYNPEFRENISIDTLTAVTTTGETVIIEEFQDGETAWFDIGTAFFTLISDIESHAGNSHIDLGFGTQGMSSATWYGLQHSPDFQRVPLPALISRRYQEETALNIGDQIGVRLQPNLFEAYVIPFEIIGVIDYFPTMYDPPPDITSQTGYMVTLQEPLLRTFSGFLHEDLQPNELVVRQAPTAGTTLASALPELYSQAAQIIELDTIRETLSAFPLAIGLRSAALFGYILATVLSVAGFSSNFILSTRQRAAQYGILRALGLAPKQLYRMLMLEQLLLVTSGLLLGTLLGIALTRLTLANLNFSWGTIGSAPPFIPIFDWLAVGRVYLLLGLIFAAALTLATNILRRANIHRSLRIGEE